jgi:DNA-binding CsgD family transcriptional regulator
MHESLEGCGCRGVGDIPRIRAPDGQRNKLYNRQVLVGRELECGRIDALLDAARAGAGGAVVVAGEPGMGKTSLLEYGVGSARDMRVVRTRGVEAEASLPFAGLVDLLTPLGEALTALPGRQAEALASALALGPAQPVDRLAVLVGTLNLLCAAAVDRPLLAVVDDGHWLDPASADAIAFAARRVGADRVAVLIATRSSGPAQLPIVRPAPLSGADSRRLLAERGFDEADVGDAVRHASGNPLALLELAESSVRGPWTRATTLEEAYAQMVAALPEDGRTAVLVLAACRSGRPAVISRALASCGLSDAAFASAERAGLVGSSAGTAIGFEFRHPLIRSAVLAAADPAQRRRVHAALAAACVERDLEWERVAHLAEAASDEDEDLALALEHLAGDVRLRGGGAATIDWYLKAAALSEDPDARIRRLFAAAEAAQAGGRPAAAEAVLTQLETAVVTPLDAARVELLRGRSEARSASTLAAADRFLVAAERLAPRDPGAAAALFVEAVDPSIRAGRPRQALAAAERAQTLARPGDAAGLEARLARSAALVFLGDAVAAARDVDEASDAVARMPAIASDLQLRAYLGMVLAFAERLGQAGRTLDRLIDECEGSAPGALTYPLISRAWMRRITGAWDGARADAQRAVRLAGQLGRRSDECWGLSILTWLGAARGRLDPALLEQQRTLAEQLDLPYQRLCVHAALGHEALGAGRADVAAAELATAVAIKRDCDIADATTRPVIGADLVEALVRLGRTADAAAEAERLHAEAARSERPSALGLAERARALVAPEGERFERAWTLHAAGADAFEQARTSLAWGDALRRAGHRVEARRRLEDARERFGELGAAPWEEQAVSALGRSGRVLRRDPVDRDELTSAELEVASLVAEGKMNKEIAAALWMSEKTVEAHLSRIYRKLGLRNRAELARRLTGAHATAAVAGPAG